MTKQRLRLILNWGFILGVVVLVKFYYAAPGRRTLGSLIVLGVAALLVLIWLTPDAVRAVRRGRSRAHEHTDQSGRTHTEPNEGRDREKTPPRKSSGLKKPSWVEAKESGQKWTRKDAEEREKTRVREIELENEWRAQVGLLVLRAALSATVCNELEASDPDKWSGNKLIWEAFRHYEEWLKARHLELWRDLTPEETAEDTIRGMAIPPQSVHLWYHDLDITYDVQPLIERIAYADEIVYALGLMWGKDRASELRDDVARLAPLIRGWTKHMSSKRDAMKGALAEWLKRPDPSVFAWPKPKEGRDQEKTPPREIREENERERALSLLCLHAVLCGAICNELEVSDSDQWWFDQQAWQALYHYDGWFEAHLESVQELYREILDIPHSVPVELILKRMNIAGEIDYWLNFTRSADRFSELAELDIPKLARHLKGWMELMGQERAKTANALALWQQRYEQTGQSGRAHTEPNAANGSREKPSPTPLDLHPSRVGVAPMTVPDTIPRLHGLPPPQATAQENFAREYESDPGRLARDYLALVERSEDPRVFSTDDAKALSPDYNPPGAPEQDALAAGCRMNLAVHNTANAVAKRAFLMLLDEIAADRSAKKRIVVSDGGVGAGKTYAIENNSHARQLTRHADAVWDSAGEQNSTEIPWVIQEARTRGIAVDVIYVLQAPDVSWERMLRRAAKSGRVVDYRLHAESYADGARNFDAIQRHFEQDSDVTFTILDIRHVAGPSQDREDEVERQKFEWRRRIAKRRRVDKGSE